MSASATLDNPHRALAEDIAALTNDPLAFVLYTYPWGEGELADSDGPREWQRQALNDIGARLKAGNAPGAALMPVLKAVASGHGIGKSAFLAWLGHWAMSTCEDCKVVLTANTQDQMRTKTWPEIAKWFRLAVNSHWFSLQGLSIVSVVPEHEKTWRMDGVTWSESNTAAFAGLHNKGKRILILYDEASEIADKVWEVTEGALTDEDTEIIWVVFGNPTQPTGRFHRCFNLERERWHGEQIDSRTVPGTNKALAAEWVKLYGEDSDFVRVRVRGMFPRSGFKQFISSEDVEAATRREARAFMDDAFVIGVDCARGGDDQSVIAFRKGADARSHPAIKMRTRDSMLVVAKVLEQYQHYRADAVFVDGGAMGGPIIDRLRQLGVPAIEVQFGGRADRISYDDTRPAYANKRAEMWGNLREWLRNGAIPDDPELRADLTGPEYSFVVRDGRDAYLLEPKEAMKKRGLASPDYADALALTLAYPVAPRPNAGRAGAGNVPMVQSEYDPFK